MADDSQVTCHICNKPIDLEADLYTDGDGKAVHEDCYVRQITRDPESSRGHLSDQSSGQSAA